MSETLFLKKSFSFFFNNKNRFDFSVIKNHFFLSSQHRSEFLSPKTIFFSTYHKTDLVFWQIHFFTNQNRSDYFQKNLCDLIFGVTFVNKFVWFNFWCHMFNISFMTCMRWYIGHKSLEDQTLFGRNECLTPSHSIT